MRKITSITAAIASMTLFLSAPLTMAAKSNDLSLIEYRESADHLPTVRSIFGIELKGYSVRIQENVYTFTKKGATTLIGKINKNGAFYSFEAIPSKGERN
ncbi:hypothetical protein [Paenibacillus pabuli]|uniref:hypothetical protein n=1 Tax=Paenibacillus pabuli TaxID=1472 RepID=UPI000783BCF4|nr:hypothetical protein [Paenibacillus pabuli]MEC0127568.1 hypothetical protein [Paenibacillus pabuli]